MSTKTHRLETAFTTADPVKPDSGSVAPLTPKNNVSRRSQSVFSNGHANQLARGLGWFSLALGLGELLAPRQIASISGVPNKNTTLIRLYGLREIATGVAIFSKRKPEGAIWSRVAGDAIDLVSLGLTLRSPESKKGRVAFATANVLAVTALDLICAQQLTNGPKGVHASGRCVVNRPRSEVYSFWRDFKNFPKFMKHLQSVEELDGQRSRWIAKAPAGTTVSWDATIVADIPGEEITWRSLENADVDNAGAVRFEQAPGGRGTIVKVNLQYNPPAGVVGSTVAKLFGEEPNQQLDDDLRRFKQVMEVGEVVVSDATLFGTNYLRQRPGRPADASEIEQAGLQNEIVPMLRERTVGNES